MATEKTPLGPVRMPESMATHVPNNNLPPHPHIPTFPRHHLPARAIGDTCTSAKQQSAPTLPHSHIPMFPHSHVPARTDRRHQRPGELLPQDELQREGRCHRAVQKPDPGPSAGHVVHRAEAGRRGGVDRGRVSGAVRFEMR